MTPCRSLFLAAFLALFLGNPATPGWAISRTWVASYGSDMANCARNTPCQSFSRALSVTDTGGVISCVDSANYGDVGINRSVTIDCTTTQGGATITASASAIYLAADSITVVLRGLHIYGNPASEIAANGITMSRAAALTIDKCVLREFSLPAYRQSPIVIDNTVRTATVIITDTEISGASGPGILIRPSGAASADVIIANSRITDARTGIRADTTATSGNVDVTIADTLLANNSYQGLVLEGGAGRVTAIATNITSANNGTHGVRALNSTAVLRLANSTLYGNGFGTDVVNGGLIQSYGNNRIIGNGVNGPALPQIGLQ